MSITTFLSIVSFGLLWSPWLVHAGTQDETVKRVQVNEAAQLPAHSYELALPLTEFLRSEAAVHGLAGAVAADLEQDFASHEILDAELERKLLQSAMAAAVIEERWEQASKYLVRGRALEEREDLQQIGGAHWEAWIAVQRELEPEADFEARRALFRTRLRALLEAQSWDLIHREIERRSARVGLVGPGLLERAMSSTLGTAAEGGTIGGATAREFLLLILGQRLLIPLKDDLASVYKEYMRANEKELDDVWGARQVNLEASANHHRVRLAIWDTGVDVEVFGREIWRNPAEVLDGTDTDGNGFVDDLHGIAYGPDLIATPELLYPPDPDESAWRQARSYSRALSDVGAAIDSAQARRLQRKLSRLDEDEVTEFVSTLQHYALHSHGTHVAGIAVKGNPFAELVVVRIGLGHEQPGERKSLAWAHRFAAMCYETVNYFKANDVRVVNMSWGWGVAEIERNLRETGAPGSDEEIQSLAVSIHEVLAQGIEGALARAPEILFVCGAGNSGEDSSHDRFVPSSSQLPNLVTIGGVDRAGGMAAFTSFGEHVSLYANGFQVMSYVPGGDREPMSGTSMASPQAANLAAKLLAIDPTLTPEGLLELMFRGADPLEFAGREVHLMNPKASIGLLEGVTSAAPGD